MSMLPPPIPDPIPGEWNPTAGSATPPTAPRPPMQPPTRTLQPDRGALILVFGLISLVLNLGSTCLGGFTGGFGCFGSLIAIGLAIPAWIMANSDLKGMARGEVDPAGRSNTSAGKILAIISLVISLLAIILGVLVVLGIFGGLAILGGAAGRP
jgi:hypothetical protein